MVAFAVKDFGGTIPRTESRNLPNQMAEQAWNCDLSSGVVEGLPTPQLIIDLSSHSPLPQRAYRIPGPVENGVQKPDIWLPLPSPYSSVCRSPLANDTNHRYYWTSPGAGLKWATYDMIATNLPVWDAGIFQPVGQLEVATSGGTLDGSIPLVDRSYVFTYENTYGEESAPSFPSAVVAGAPDGTWTVSLIPTLDGIPTIPQGDGKHNYPPITKVNLYRTVTGATTGAQFYLVTSWQVQQNLVPSAYNDTTSDTDIVNNNQLYSSAFNNPLDNLDGLTALPGGMLVGFTDNTVHFCEPNRPHAWPAAYDESVQYDIVGFGVWQQSLVVMTSGFPSTGTGNSPANFVFAQVRVPEPCISRGSIITDLMGVYYASQNGLVMLNYFGMQNQTLTTVTKNIWLTTYAAASIIACRHRSQYLAINGTGSGFLIDYAEQRMGIVQLNTFDAADCVWNDEYTGDAYICAGGKVYLWDSPTSTPLIYRWRSKQFYGPAPVSLGAAQVSMDPDILTATPPSTPPLSNGDPTLVLPAGVNAVFNLYAGPDGEHLVHSQNLTEVRNIFRLPSGFKSFDWQCEVIGCVGLRSIELGSTMKELKGV